MSLTKWDVGQCLIKCADTLHEEEDDLREAGYEELAKMLHECRLTIGDHFNKFGSHEFGLPAHDQTTKASLRRCEPCGGPGPSLWDPKTGRYSCKKCHSQPNDPFFVDFERRTRGL